MLARIVLFLLLLLVPATVRAKDGMEVILFCRPTSAAAGLNNYRTFIDPSFLQAVAPDRVTLD